MVLASTLLIWLLNSKSLDIYCLEAFLNVTFRSLVSRNYFSLSSVRPRMHHDFSRFK